MKKFTIKDLNDVVELSVDEAVTIQGGLDNKPTAPKPLGYDLIDVPDNTVDLPTPGTWLGASDFVKS